MRDLSRIAPDDACHMLQGWSPGSLGGVLAITKTYKFSNFRDAFAVMTAVAIEAEKMDHHPEWTNVYNMLSISLTTHDASGVTQLDIELATKIDVIAEKFLA